MIDFSEVFIMGDQPVTCPNCGNRTHFLREMQMQNEQLQLHECMTDKCKKMVVVVERVSDLSYV
jgi:hypothetical protein